MFKIENGKVYFNEKNLVEMPELLGGARITETKYFDYARALDTIKKCPIGGIGILFSKLFIEAHSGSYLELKPLKK